MEEQTENVKSSAALKASSLPFQEMERMTTSYWWRHICCRACQTICVVVPAFLEACPGIKDRKSAGIEIIYRTRLVPNQLSDQS